jgi:hypothetical protein
MNFDGLQGYCERLCPEPLADKDQHEARAPTGLSFEASLREAPHQDEEFSDRNRKRSSC